MSTTRYINGQPYLIPDQGDTYVWGTDLSNWIGAVSNSTLQKSGGPFTLSGEVDFGPTAGIKSAYFSGRANGASAGLIRLSNTDTIQFRNAANTGNNVLSVSGDVLTYSGIINGSGLINVPGAQISGTVAVANGGTGSTTASDARTALGLGNVDNTSDANKPISTATQAALNLKADLASPALTGTPTAPTPATGTRSTQLATTQMFANEFTSSRVSGSPGWQKLPNGTIIQWGYAGTGSGVTGVTFPVAFTTALLATGATMLTSTSSGIIWSVSITAQSLTGMNICRRFSNGATVGDATEGANWFAIGY